ncbi:MAG: T9SS C-terminal target domain-containing protein [Candidatus Zixiibacteriota bacterium]|nr:MAG: T9SS C-terminal target domain-containing protein [candidate division Zixibacteria bacterium]
MKLSAPGRRRGILRGGGIIPAALFWAWWTVAAGAQWGDHVERVSESLIWGPFRDVQWSGGKAWAAMGYGLAVFDVTNPSQIELESFYGAPGSSEGVFVAGDLAYLAGGTAGFQILDVSNPAAPALLGERDTPGYAYDLAVQDGILYLADGSGGLRLFDVSDPADPQPLSHLVLDGWVRAVQVQDSLVYLAADNAGLKIVNAALPAQPQILGQYNTPGIAQGLRYSGGLLYLCDGPNGLLIFNAADPSAPALAGQWTTTPGSAHAVEVSGNYAYLAHGTGGLAVLNVTVPSLPYLVGQYDTPGQARALAFHEANLFLADDAQGLHAIWAANPQAPALLDSWSQPGEVLSVWAAGRYAYAARGYLGRVTILDVLDPAAPLDVSRIEFGYPTTGVKVLGNVCYSAHLDDGVQFTDVANPLSPHFIGRKNTVGEALDQAPRWPYLYIADASEGLVVVSLTNPDSAWHVATSDFAQGVELRGDTAYVSQWSAGVALADVSDPVNPQIVAEYDTPGLARRCVPLGNYLYVADGSSGLVILNLNGAPVGQYDTGGLAGDVKVAGGLAFVADGTGGLLVLDVSNPAQPVYAGSYRTPGPALEVHLSGGEIYVACQYALGLYRFTGLGVPPLPPPLPAGFSLTAHPNPFNPQTTIGYRLPAPGYLRLRVYDTAGREVATLAEGWRAAGAYEARFDGSGLVSGVYVVKLESGEYEAQTKVVLLK